MIDYELARRLFRSFLFHNLKGEIFIGELPSFIPVNLDILSPIDVIASIVHADASCEIILEERSRDSKNKILVISDYLKNNGWIEASYENSKSRKGLVNSKIQWLFSIEILQNNEETLYWISLRKNLPAGLHLFRHPQIVSSEFSEVLSLPSISLDFKFSQQLLRKPQTESDALEMSILKTDLSVLELSIKYTHQLDQLGWKLCHNTNTDTFHASSWVNKIGDNIIYHLMLGINSLGVNNEYIVTISIRDVTWNNYPDFLTQAATPKSKIQSIPAEIFQKIVKIFQKDPVSVEFVSENFTNEHMPLQLPPGSEVIGIALIENKAIKVFANFPLNGLQSFSYITESFQALGWEPLLIVPFRSGKGFIDSGFDFAIPRFFFWPSMENGEKQISIRTFPLSNQWTDVEIDYRPKVFETAPCDDELNSFREMYLEYPILPSLQPHEDSFVQCTGEFLDHGLFYSKADLIFDSNIEILIEHYTKQLSSSGEWTEISNAREQYLFVSTWSGKDSKDRRWFGVFSLAGIEENLQNYLLQFTAFQVNKPKVENQGFFNKLMGKLMLRN